MVVKHFADALFRYSHFHSFQACNTSVTSLATNEVMSRRLLWRLRLNGAPSLNIRLTESPLKSYLRTWQRNIATMQCQLTSISVLFAPYGLPEWAARFFPAMAEQASFNLALNAPVVWWLIIANPNKHTKFCI